jgi:hypothetical protein
MDRHGETDEWQDLLWVTDPIAGLLRGAGRAAVEEGAPFARRLLAREGAGEAEDEFKSILASAARVGVKPEEGFSSYSKLKRVLGPKPKGNDYHHIVEQSNVKHGTLPSELVNNPNNIVEIPRGIHQKISGYYSRKLRFTGGLTVREWARQLPYDEQYRFGQGVVKDAEAGKLP